MVDKDNERERNDLERRREAVPHGGGLRRDGGDLQPDAARSVLTSTAPGEKVPASRVVQPKPRNWYGVRPDRIRHIRNVAAARGCRDCPVIPVKRFGYSQYTRIVI